jgi:hypothetical protein
VLGADGDRMVHGCPEEISAGVEWHCCRLCLTGPLGGTGLEGVAARAGRSPGVLPADPGVAMVRVAQASGSPAGPAVGTDINISQARIASLNALAIGSGRRTCP